MRQYAALLVLISYAPIAAQLFTASIPDLGEEFGLSLSLLQWSVSLFLLFYALSQLIYGPLANSIGRKNAFKIGIGITVVGTIFALVASAEKNYLIFLFGRSLIGLGCGASLSLTLTIIREYFSSKEARKVTSFATGALVVVPGIAIFCGGYIAEWFGWKGSFYAVGIYSIGMYGALYMIPETKKGGFEPFHFQYVIEKYKNLLCITRLTLFTVVIGMSTFIFYVYSTVGPMLVITEFGFSPSMFGVLSLLPSIGLILGSFLSIQLSYYKSALTSAKIGLFVAAIGALILDGAYMLALYGPIPLFIALTLLYAGVAIIYTNGIHLATDGIEDRSNAMSIVSFLSVVIGCFGSVASGFFSTTVALAPVILLTIPIIVIRVIFLFAHKFAHEI